MKWTLLNANKSTLSKVDITYNICPKGHKHEVNREERIR